MVAVALPSPYEAAIQEMERLGRAACDKIDEATKAVLGDEGSFIDDDSDEHPSIVRHAIALAREADRAKRITGTPVGNKLPVHGRRPTDGDH